VSTAEIAPEHATDRRRWAVLAVALTGAFLVIGGVSIVNLAMPSMQSTLHTSANTVALVIASYSLVYAIFLIAGGRLGDLAGRKTALMAGLALFTVAVAACGLAPTAGSLIAARVLQGLGAALIYPQILSIIEETFDGQERNFALGLFGATIGGAVVAGQLIGGALIQLDLGGLSWRPAFLVLVPVGVVALAEGHVSMTNTTSRTRHRHLDFGGILILGSALTMLILPLLEGRAAGWPWWLVAVLVAALPALASFFAYERRLLRSGRVPLLDPALFRQRSFSVGSAMGIVFFMGSLGFAVYTSLVLQTGAGFSTMRAGLAFAPTGLALLAASLTAPRLIPRLGRHVLSIGYAVLAAGLVATFVTVEVAGPHLSVWTLAPALIAVGAGQGFGMSPLVGTVLSGVRKTDAGAASGALTTSFQVGQTLGIALVGTVFFTLVGAGEGSQSERYLFAYRGLTLFLAALAAVLFLLVFLLPRPTARADVFLDRHPHGLAGLVHAAYLATGGRAGERLVHKILAHHQNED
jgi:MFS family permease